MFSNWSISFVLLSLVVFVASVPLLPPGTFGMSPQLTSQMMPNCMIPCPLTRNPVCGTDRITYRNLCQLNFVRRCQNKPLLSLANYGECSSTTSCSVPCPKINNPVCGSDGKTYESTCHLDKEKRCKNKPLLRIANYGSCTAPACRVKCPFTLFPRRVCGSDGKTYSSLCELNNVKRCDKKPDLYVEYPGYCRQCMIAPCPKIDKPVCGSDGKTYDSNCHLNREKACKNKFYLYVAYQGKCSSSSCRKTCPFTLRMQRVCGSDGKTYVSECELNNAKKCENKPDLTVAYPGICRLTPQCMVYCRMNYMPVCGTDKKTYRNICLLSRTRNCEKKWKLTIDYFGPCSE